MRLFEESIKSIVNETVDNRNIVNLRTTENIDGVYRCTLTPGKLYAFESAGSDYKVQLYNQDGGTWSHLSGAIGGLIIYTPTGQKSKIIAINGKPSLLNLLDIFQSELFTVNISKPDIYLEGLDGKNFTVWEIG